MLTMDVTKLSQAELISAVAQRCAEFGNVADVRILRPPDKPQIAFALVDMNSSGEVDRVVNHLGAAKVESLAVLRIERENFAESTSVFRRRWLPNWATLD